MNDIGIFTRRDFMKGLGLVTLGATLPSFLTGTAAAATSGAIPGFADDRILVVIQLGGGNDGINTVVPYGDDTYWKLRPRIAVPKDKLLKIDDYMALPQSLEPLKDLYDSGDLAIVNGVGYPNPDRSHFRSMEIWHTAVDSDHTENTGWIGRYFDNCCNGKPDPIVGVNVGSEIPQAFDSRRGAGVSFQDPGQFRWRDGKRGDTRAAFDTVNKTAHTHDDEGETIDFLRHTTANAVISSDRVIKASKVKRTKPTYPGGALSKNLQSIATLIAGGLPTRIFYAGMGGFDTHTNEANTHERLMKEAAGAIAAFRGDLKAIGALDRVTIFTFSEFGRRVQENASGGTDHGTAGPMFVMGPTVKPGLHGKYPSLTDLDDGDLKFSVDFRSIYGELIGNWFKSDATKVLGREFPGAGLFKA